jgi:hypothetical protein
MPNVERFLGSEVPAGASLALLFLPKNIIKTASTLFLLFLGLNQETFLNFDACWLRKPEFFGVAARSLL